MTRWAEEREHAADERDDTLHREHEVALTVPCVQPPHGCEAAAGEDCRNLRTGARMGPRDSRGRRVSRQAAHRQRVKNGERLAAEQAARRQPARNGGSDAEQ